MKIWSGKRTAAQLIISAVAALILSVLPMEVHAVSFDGALALDVGSGPRGVAAGDFNGDGKTDLAVVNAGSYTVSVILSNGDNTFAAAVNYATGYNPYSVAVGDFNDDGDLDIVAANYGSNNVTVFLNDGDGTFDSGTNYSVGSSSGPYSVVVGDFDKDGYADIATANYGNAKVYVLLNDGDGTFDTNTASYTVASSPRSIVAADFDNDTYPDLVTVSNIGGGNNVSVLLNDGDGTFGSASYFTAGSGPYAVAAGDFNGDGKADLAMANYSGTNVSVYLGDGDGTFGDVTNYSVGSAAYSVTIGDFNEDGKADIATVNYNGAYVGTASVLLGNGNGTFGTAVTYNMGHAACYSIATGDFNDDGNADLATGEYFSENNAYILMGKGDGTFAAAANYSTGTNPQYIAAGDLDNDGDADLVTASASIAKVSVHLNNGTGTFGSANYYDTGSYPVSISIGDLDNDGYADLVTANQGSNNISVLLNDGDGTFGSATNYSEGSIANSVTIGYFNNDSYKDIATTISGSNVVSVRLNNGDGTFGSASSYTVGSGPVSIVTGDFNGDGKADLATANYGSVNISVLLGAGDGTFGTATNYSLVSAPYSIAMGDFDNDGDVDLVTSDANSYYVSVFLNNGSGSYGSAVRYAAGTGILSNTSIAVGDFNGDGDIDITVASVGAHNVVLLPGAGDGTFGPAMSYAAGQTSRSVAAGDFDDDGKIDLAASNTTTHNITVYLNNMLRITESAGPNGSLACNPLMVNPGGGSTCSVEPDTNYQIDSVSGCGGSLNGGTYTISNVTADCTVTASFTPIMHQLGVSITGSGTVTSSPSGIDCGSTCNANFMQATNVTLTAADGSGYSFAEWGGDCSGTSSETSVSMTANKSCTAIFVGATLTSDYASPQTRGTTIEFTGGGLGPAWTFEYRFRLKQGSGEYSTVQEYSSDNTWTWDTSSVTPDTYTVQVQVRKQGSSVYYHAYKTMSYVINWPPVSGVLVNPTFTAQGSGGSGSYEYKFRRYNGTTWDTMQDYSATPSWTWDTTGFAPGTYTVQVHVRNAGSGVAYDVAYNWDYSINYDSLITATLSASPASPQNAGTEIELTATGSGGTGYYEYKFRRWTGSAWVTEQEYSSDNTWTWVTTGYQAGGYTLQVHVRRQGSTAAYEVVKLLQYTLQ